MINRKLFLLLAIQTSLIAYPQLSLKASLQPIEIKPALSTGLESVYVVASVAELSATFESSHPEQVKWMCFSNLGGGYAQEINDVTVTATSSVLPKLEGNMGYIVSDNGVQHCFWVIDYSTQSLRFDGLDVSRESGCSNTILNFYGNAAPIVYYTTNGRKCELPRDITLAYRSLEYQPQSDSYHQREVSTQLDHINSSITVEAPLCDTDFTLTGDKFLQAWDKSISIATDTYIAVAVNANTTATQQSRDISNEIKTSADGLGGSAPTVIDFHATISDAVVFKEWQISSQSEFEQIDFRHNDVDMSHTFLDEGTQYVRFKASNSHGSCDYISPTYIVNIGTSELTCPNTFSPGVSEGINDEWKVSYKSITRFDCHIYNRWGNEVAHLTDPSQGWDGRIGNRFAPAGVYYYVISAQGADKKKYNLRGDINIINQSGSTLPR